MYDTTVIVGVALSVSSIYHHGTYRGMGMLPQPQLTHHIIHGPPTTPVSPRSQRFKVKALCVIVFQKEQGGWAGWINVVHEGEVGNEEECH